MADPYEPAGSERSTTDSEDNPKPYIVYRNWEHKLGELSTPQKREARALLFGRFGQKTEFFTKQPINPRFLHVGAYDLHHLVERGAPGCNLLPNLRLAYHGPNANAGKPSIQKTYRDRTRPTQPIDPTVQLREIVDYGTGSKEMQANAEAEPEYRGWLWEKLLMENCVTKDTAI